MISKKCRHLDPSIQYRHEHFHNSIDGLSVYLIHFHQFRFRHHFISFQLSEFHNFPIMKCFVDTVFFGQKLFMRSPMRRQQYCCCIIQSFFDCDRKLCLSSSRNSDSKKNYYINLKKPNFLAAAWIMEIFYSLWEDIFYLIFPREKMIKIWKGGVDFSVKFAGCK